MLFYTELFMFVFLPIVLILYFSLMHYNRVRTAKSVLVLASLFFYAYDEIAYLPILVGSIIVNYWIGRYCYLQAQRTVRATILPKLLFCSGIVLNLAVLGYYKYFNFLLDNINFLFNTQFSFLQRVILPLGISFYTFQQICYLFDSYALLKNKPTTPQHVLPRLYTFIDYALFVSFFPQLVAGPIVLPSEMLPQFEDKANRKFNYENACRALFIFSIGLFKKVVLADFLCTRFADLATTATLPTLTTVEAYFASLGFTLQLYFDFSGYCDMAIGIALLFNIVLPLNFNSPYKSANFQDFWRRWHMTLGRFMMNYLYIPLGGNRKGTKRTLFNLWTVFLLSGLWHGAG